MDADNISVRRRASSTDISLCVLLKKHFGFGLGFDIHYLLEYRLLKSLYLKIIRQSTYPHVSNIQYLQLLICFR